jgi:hypothetical protein
MLYWRQKRKIAFSRKKVLKLVAELQRLSAVTDGAGGRTKKNPS